MTRSPHDLALRKDPVMRRVIDAVGPQPAYYRERTDFETACRIIVGQQLSYAAATTIWGRVRDAAPRWQPADVAGLAADRLRALGLSRSKATFIHELATRTDSGDLNFRRIRRGDDEAAAEALRGIKGFGPWSVEMCELYGVPPGDYEARIGAIAARWSPWRSHACRYLWGWLESSARKAKGTG